MKTAFVKLYRQLGGLHPLFRIFILSVVLMPFTFVLGSVVLFVYFAAWFLPPVYAWSFIVNDSWLLSLLVLIGWLFLMKPLWKLAPRLLMGAEEYKSRQTSVRKEYGDNRPIEI